MHIAELFIFGEVRIEDANEAKWHVGARPTALAASGVADLSLLCSGGRTQLVPATRINPSKDWNADFKTTIFAENI